MLTGQRIGQPLVSRPRAPAHRQQRGRPPHQQVPAKASGRLGAGAYRRANGLERCRKGRHQQGADHVGAYSHTHPEGPVEGDPAGQAEEAVPAGHRQGTRDRTRHRALVRFRRATAHKKLSAQERAMLQALRKFPTAAN